MSGGAPLRGRDLALVLVIVATWALNFLTSARALQEIPPILFTALRFALLALPLAFMMRRPPAGQCPRSSAHSSHCRLSSNTHTP